MDWILQNFQIFVALIVVVIWVIRTVAGANKPQDENAPPRSAPTEDAAEADRTRQIQEEIRRRILARQRGEPTHSPGSPAPPPIVVYQERPDEVESEEEYLEEGPRRPLPSVAARHQAEEAHAAILDQQRLLAEQLHALRVARASAPGAIPRAAYSLQRDAVATNQREFRRELMLDLRHPSSLRRAFLLREVLGQPLALQRGWNLTRR